MTTLFGKVRLSPEGDGSTPKSEEEKNEKMETVIKVGEKEITNDELQAMMDSEAADSIELKVGDGKSATLKTLREMARREPDTQRILQEVNEQRETLKADRAKFEEERTQIVKEMGEGSTAAATQIANAIRTALGQDEGQDRLRDKASALAYIKTLLVDKQDGVAALSAIVEKLYADKDASTAEAKKMLDEIKGKLAELEKKQSDKEVETFMRDEIKSIRVEFPDYDPDGDDEFSVGVSRLLVKATPSKILDGKIGKEMPAVEVARLYASYLDKQADARVSKKTEAQRKRDETDATLVPGRSVANATLPDDLQKELDAAGNDLDKINAVSRKWSDRLRKRR